MTFFRWITCFGDIVETFSNALKKVKNIGRSVTINEILVYGHDDDELKKEVGLNNLFCIYYIIAQACLTIDICVPTLESDTITNCLTKVKQKNMVKIRISVHQVKDLCNVEYLAEQGIQIKMIKPSVKLEYEFILIDADVGSKEAVAILGSLDYEINKVNCSRDLTIISSDHNLIASLRNEFDRVWNSTSDVEPFQSID